LNHLRVVGDLLQLFVRKSRVIAGLEHVLRLRKPERTFWTWEVYSLGATLRRTLGLGWGSEIKTGSDHGISLATAPSQAEENMRPAPYVTWSSWRASLKFSDERPVYRVQHPWIPYRRLKGFTKSPKARGTLVFVPHSVPNLSYEGFELEGFIEMVNQLPKEFRPFTFCLQFHDANLSTALKIARFNVRVVTLGNSLSPSFANRFYSLISKYEFATSPSIGSQLFYSHELGVRYFLLDPEKQFQRRLQPTQGIALPNKEIVNRIEEAFDFGNLETHSREKDAIVYDALGLGLDAAQNFGYTPILKSINRKWG